MEYVLKSSKNMVYGKGVIWSWFCEKNIGIKVKEVYCLQRIANSFSLKR